MGQAFFLRRLRVCARESVGQDRRYLLLRRKRMRCKCLWAEVLHSYSIASFSSALVFESDWRIALTTQIPLVRIHSSIPLNLLWV
jgi:hypothetical protein